MEMETQKLFERAVSCVGKDLNADGLWTFYIDFLTQNLHMGQGLIIYLAAVSTPLTNVH